MKGILRIAYRLLVNEKGKFASQLVGNTFVASEEALWLIKAKYKVGNGNNAQVLIANGQYLQARIGCLQAQAHHFQDTVALFVALVG